MTDAKRCDPPVDLIVDLIVALEGLLYPDLADKRVDPTEVNARALAWIYANAMDAPPPPSEKQGEERERLRTLLYAAWDAPDDDASIAILRTYGDERAKAERERISSDDC